MRPLKSAVPLAKWLLRIALLGLVYQAYFNTFLEFSFNNAEYFFALILVVFAILLVLGGFLSKPSLTVVSGLIVFLVFIVLLFIKRINSLEGFINYFVPASIGFYFLARGNRG